ncbi:peptidase domain-containing ABC transporter [Chryseobacterium indologenes]|uniref:peptidase domain-containing ABC transporter n=1 Tax=Chryseobacterium indologenes TaxID=253 RepID=UPI000F4DD849|nr:peptidase domain-containing ABC transporter [Chryseobacterium indologenes]AYZ34820.1 peptidase domain-containing ABC transporter [Chryseobacterium indologenes]MBF6643412.1 peptidase domain-containing ABC transporter [Chryseobacterium indologenes]MBU3049975.1 peptidase domain-containing ABC transporter [Chryseobacterium indologenes]MEB4762533.1 peptidase domain-containing ABC transporter [Chryseobacterium indologenes]QQQ72705.1 peptidase domain-containing ABC transporter [Chryseobacterium in
MNFIPQHDQMDCGPACLAMIASHYGVDFGLQYLRDKSFITKEGVSLLGICEAAEKIGMKTVAVKSQLKYVDNSLLPCILHWNQNHFVVLHKISKNVFTRKPVFKIADPGHGYINLSEEKLKKSWISGEEKGVVLFLEPTEEFYKQSSRQEKKISVKFLLNHLKPYKRQMLQMLLLLLFGTITTLVFPVLTQKLMDEGVSKKDLSVISYILIAQLAFFLGNIIFNIFRNWIMLIVGTNINIRIISDFLKKLLKLPIKFFDTKLMGDFSQRIQDHERIESFLTSQSLITLFSAITFTVFFGVLWYYDFTILLVYVALTAISVLWSLFWMKKRKVLDYFRFQQRSENQESIYEIINGVSEMKLNQFEKYKRKKWEEIQQKLLKVNIRILKLDQIQLSGFEFINQLKNIIVTFLAASFVVKGSMTLGELLSVSYIIGQMNSPVNELIQFFRSLQDAKLSLSRLHEVHDYAEEEKEYHVPLLSEKYTRQNGIERGIYFKNVSFQYEGPRSPYVLKNINLFIPEGKITAIVGASGSGKTTLIKMFLKFYEPVEGDVFFNHLNAQDISPKDLRENCGTVMQEGYIFSDTIERNIAAGDENIDYEKLEKALHIANIKSFVEELPLGLKTKIGASGNGISGGQKQRILIARAVYKNPYFIFFDEATSALDADNEKIIHDNLQSFFKGKTAVIVAHRLSTVRNADQIIVLKHGEIVEKGSHEELVSRKSDYYNLVKNQLELGN